MVRDLNGLPVRQNHKTGMFNANDLLTIYNEQNPEAPKRMQNYMDNKATIEYMDYLSEVLTEENSNHSNSSDLGFDFGLNKIRPESIVKTSRGRINGGTWMQQHLFIDFAMWLSLPLKHWAITCVGDKLIKFRDQAGDSFLEVNQALKAIHGEQRQPVYIREARMINGLVFENGKGGQRNDASEKELDLLDRLQKADIKLILAGKNFKERKHNLRIYKNLSE